MFSSSPTDYFLFRDNECQETEVRAWGLLQGLQHAGLRVTYAAPERVAWPGWDRNRLSGFEVVLFRSASELTEAIRNNNPDAIVVVNWEFLEWLPEDLHIPIVVDLIAPRLLEIQFQEYLPHGFSAEMLRYVDALSLGDRFPLQHRAPEGFLLFLADDERDRLP